MSYTIQGKVKTIFETQNITESFKKREFVVTTNEQYPNIGQEVKVEFNLRGRKWVNPDGESKYFNTLQAWRIGSVGMVDNFDDLHM